MQHSNHNDNNDNANNSSLALTPLPFGNYHRASHVGAGSFGSVVIVYNDDGEEYALKLFENDDNDDDEEGNDEDNEYDDEYDDDEEYQSTNMKPISLGALREISCLRLLRGQHANIVNMMDIQPEWSDNEVENTGAGTSGHLGMALPYYKYGSLYSAIEKNMFISSTKITKVKLAHDILSSIIFLHDNGILHRDIKSDNIILNYNNNNDTWNAILIDFSLAKPINNVIWNDTNNNNYYNNNNNNNCCWDNVEHTGEVGTIVYTAPEIMNNESYGMSADIYSIGVVLLELISNHIFTAFKQKDGINQIKDALQQLPTGVPFPDLVRSMLHHDPSQRPTAREAVENSLFINKFQLKVPKVKLLNIATILPYEVVVKSDDGVENEPPNVSNKNNNNTTKKVYKRNNKSNKVGNRMKLIDQVCKELESQHPLTRIAAYEYSEILCQINDDMDDGISQSLLDCVVLAHRFFEFYLLNLKDLNDKKYFDDWSMEEYIDTESTIFMLSDYCLYPRKNTI